jgi:predicted transcriptional regulator
MRSGLKSDSRAAKLAEAIRSGAATTSRELAVMFGSSTTLIAPELSRLADMGVIARDRTEMPKRPGRPCLRWRAL